jgi:hypothetical protein
MAATTSPSAKQRPAATRALPKQTRRYAWVFITGLLCSIFYLLRAAHGAIADAPRGGALAVCLAFAVLFVRPDYGKMAYDQLTGELKQLQDQARAGLVSLNVLPAQTPLEAAIDALSLKVNAVFSNIATNADGMSRQNKWLAATTILGTLVTAYGDMLAEQIRVFPWLMSHTSWFS